MTQLVESDTCEEKWRSGLRQGTEIGVLKATGDATERVDKNSTEATKSDAEAFLG